MRKYKGRILLLSFLCAFVLSGCEKRAAEEAVEPGQKSEYVVVLPSARGKEEESQKIQEQISSLIQERLGVTISFELIDIGSYEQETKKRLASGKQTDIIVNMSNMCVEGWMRGELLPLDDLLEAYGKEIQENVGEKTISYCAIDGSVYGIPNVRDYAVLTDTYYLNREILERNHLDASSITSMEELEEAFRIVHEKEPDISILSTNLWSLCANSYYLCANTAYPIGVLEQEGAGEHYMNLFQSDYYREKLEKIRDWYQQGYIHRKLEGNQVTQQDEEVFAYVRCGKPGGEQELQQTFGGSYSEIVLGEPVITQDSYSAILYSITSETISAEISMKILDYFYQSDEINQLLSRIIPEWLVPNLFLTEPGENAPEDLWEQTKIFNETARKSKDIGFVFDPSAVMQEYLQAGEVYSCYRPVLENGILDTEETLQRMNQELQQAGIEKVIEEKNRQYQVWLKKENLQS